MRATLALTLLIAGIALGLSAARILDGRSGLEHRVSMLEVLACGFAQFEDYSVMYQADDRSRELCVGYVRGEVECERVSRDGHEYLVNCRE